MFSTIYPPKYLEKVFTCPHCNVATNQKWYSLQKSLISENPILKSIPHCIGNSSISEVLFSDNEINDRGMYELVLEWNVEISVCNQCKGYVIWEGGKHSTNN